MATIILAAHGRITTRHKQNIGRGFPHRGIDQGHNNSTAYDLQIMAPADGVVVTASRFYTYGLHIVIRHDDGMVSLLAHHARHYVTVGQRVTQGQIIAVMGNTGTRYVHSHQELRSSRFGKQLDPLEHIAPPVTAAAVTQAPINITSTEEDDDMKIQIIQPFGLPDRGVIGDVAYAFPSEGSLAHFKNVWRGKIDNIDQVTVVGDKNMTEKARRDVFNLLIEIHKSK